MKIVHICLAGSYNDNWGYQDNIIPKYHKFSGNDVTVITSLFINSRTHNGYEKVEAGEYMLENNIKIIRLPFKNCKVPKLVEKFRIYEGLINKLIEEKPNLIFIHGPQFVDIRLIRKYLEKNKDIKVVVDNHADFTNSARNFISKNFLHKIVWKRCVDIIEPFTSKFYGVLPARVDFLIEMYNTPIEKTELLVMGADDEKIQFSKKDVIKKNIRLKYNISPNDFLIITGGKFDSAKTEVLNLMKVVNALTDPKIKLLIFGSIENEFEKAFKEQLKDDRIKYIGWIKSDEVYDYFLSSDLAIFPGRHSVLWEQAVGCGIPCIFRKWHGTSHVDVGGNCMFLKDGETDSIKELIEKVYFNDNMYQNMLNIAINRGINEFSYRKISAKSIDI